MVMILLLQTLYYMKNLKSNINFGDRAIFDCVIEVGRREYIFRILCAIAQDAYLRLPAIYNNNNLR